MDVKKVVKELKVKYPGRNIILNPPENPTEIVCEIEPASQNPDKSVAIAVLDKNVTHTHRQAKEVYEVIRGILEVNKAGKTHILHPGQKITVLPGEHHMAKGKEAWVKVTSTPAWTPEDYVLVDGG